MIPTGAATNEDQAEASEQDVAGAGRSAIWRWFICGLLLLATVVNYMDRLTVNALARPIQNEFQLNNEDYGNLELGFGLAFAAGSLLFGWMVDRIGVYWLYPIVLIGWSTMGYLTGLSRSYQELLLLRIGLGIFEAGHFPCGLKTIQQLMAPRDRAMGCSLLQSGTALGAIIAPLAIKLLKTNDPSGWRMPFLVIGAAGSFWVVLWFLSIRPRDLRRVAISRKVDSSAADKSAGSGETFWSHVFSARFFSLAVMVVCINLNWHFFRVWLPKLLQESRGFTQDQMLDFTMLYYIAADLGAIAAGLLTGYLARRKMSVFASRMSVFAGCCFLTTLTTLAALLPSGRLLEGTLLIVAAGGLGSYAAYYSMTQDLSMKHQGKISGALSTITWLVTASFHPLFGRYLDKYGYYDYALGAVGWLPMIALVTVFLLWHSGRGKSRAGLAEVGTITTSP